MIYCSVMNMLSMRDETFKNFLSKNSYQLIAASFYLAIALFGAYVTLELFKQSTTTHIQAVESDVNDIKLSIKDLTRIAQDVAVVKSKVEDSNKQLDSQGEKIDKIIQYQLEKK